MIGCNITASGMWFFEFDTYKVGVTRMSTSTMHTLLKKRLDYDDFCFHNVYDENYNIEMELELTNTFEKIFKLSREILNSQIDQNKKLMLIKTILPESFNYTSYVTLNYEVLRTMYHDRKNHRLPEWKMFLESFDSIPYFNEFIKGE